MNPFPAFLLLLVALLLPGAGEAHASALTPAGLADRWRIDEIVNEQTGEALPGRGATLEFRADGSFADGRDGSSGTWRLEGDLLDLSYGGNPPRWLVGEASLSAGGILVWSCHTEEEEEEVGRTAWDDNTRITLVSISDEQSADDGASPNDDEPVCDNVPADDGDSVEALFPQGAWIDGDGVHLRADASTGSRSLGKLKRGEGVEVTADGPYETLGRLGHHRWWKVTVPRTGKRGWVFGAFVKPVEGCSH